MWCEATLVVVVLPNFQVDPTSNTDSGVMQPNPVRELESETGTTGQLLSQCPVSIFNTRSPFFLKVHLLLFLAISLIYLRSTSHLYAKSELSNMKQKK